MLKQNDIQPGNVCDPCLGTLKRLGYQLAIAVSHPFLCVGCEDGHAEWVILTSKGWRDIPSAWKIGPGRGALNKTSIQAGRLTLRIANADIIKATAAGEFEGIEKNRPQVTTAGLMQVRAWLQATGSTPSVSNKSVVHVKTLPKKVGPSPTLVDLNAMSIADIETVLATKRRAKAVGECRDALTRCAAEHGFALGDCELLEVAA